MKILNGLPLGAVKNEQVLATEVSTGTARLLALSQGVESYVGHADTAKVLSGVLRIEVVCNRATADLRLGEIEPFFLVAAYCGDRLQEGATTLPSGAKFRFFVVSEPKYDIWAGDGYLTVTIEGHLRQIEAEWEKKIVALAITEAGDCREREEVTVTVLDNVTVTLIGEPVAGYEATGRTRQYESDDGGRRSEDISRAVGDSGYYWVLGFWGIK